MEKALIFRSFVSSSVGTSAGKPSLVGSGWTGGWLRSRGPDGNGDDAGSPQDPISLHHDPRAAALLLCLFPLITHLVNACNGIYHSIHMYSHQTVLINPLANGPYTQPSPTSPALPIAPAVPRAPYKADEPVLATCGDPHGQFSHSRPTDEGPTPARPSKAEETGLIFYSNGHTSSSPLAAHPSRIQPGNPTAPGLIPWIRKAQFPSERFCVHSEQQRQAIPAKLPAHSMSQGSRMRRKQKKGAIKQDLHTDRVAKAAQNPRQHPGNPPREV
jgi:hypothetical protein